MMPVFTHALEWMRPQAPYMPIACIGLLRAIEAAGGTGTFRWETAEGGLTLETPLSLPDVADAAASAPWPDVDAIPWGQPVEQALKRMLKDSGAPVAELRRLRDAVAADGRSTESDLLSSIVTDSVLDTDGIPSRARLMRGVKADLSGVADRVKIGREGLLAELEGGPAWIKGSSGRGLGLIPEVQTFGGTTGPQPSGVGSFSPLLFRLLWLGLLELPPIGVRRGRRRIVGGVLVTDPETISWPVWRSRAGRQELRHMYALAAVHDEAPLATALRPRSIDAVYRSRAVAISTSVAVFRWGQRVV